MHRPSPGPHLKILEFMQGCNSKFKFFTFKSFCKFSRKEKFFSFYFLFLSPTHVCFLPFLLGIIYPSPRKGGVRNPPQGREGYGTLSNPEYIQMSNTKCQLILQIFLVLALSAYTWRPIEKLTKQTLKASKKEEKILERYM